MSPDGPWKRENPVGEYYYHGGMHVYKQSAQPGHWGSECAYRDSHLVLGDPHSGTADLYPDGTWQHFLIDPGGPRMFQGIPFYWWWLTHPHPYPLY